MWTAHHWAQAAEKMLFPSGQLCVVPQGEGAGTLCPGFCECFDKTPGSGGMVERSFGRIQEDIAGFDLTSSEDGSGPGCHCDL